MIEHPLLSRFDLIIEGDGNIAKLRKLVIHLAVSGRLASDPYDTGSLNERLTEIVAKRHALEEKGLISKRRPFPPIDESELPAGCTHLDCFERLGHIAILEKGRTGIQTASPGNFPLVTTAQERSSCDHFDFEGRAAIIPMVSSTGHGNASLKRLHYQEGRFALGNILCAAFPISEAVISARFIFEYLSAFKEELLVSKMFGTANVSLTIGKIGEVPVPLVAPSVQRRVHELLELCDRLENAHREREFRRQRFTTGLLHRFDKPTDEAEHQCNIQLLMSHLPTLTMRKEQLSEVRHSIINLAVQGRLVQQSPSDEPPEQLLARIRRLRANGPSPSQSQISDDTDSKLFKHLPVTLPPQWITCPLEDLVRFIDYRGRTPERTASGVRLITAKNVRMGYVSDDPVEFIAEDVYTKWMTRGFPRPGDLLFVTEGATMGFAAPLDLPFKFALAQRTIDLQPYDTGYSRFLLFVLMSSMFQGAIQLNATGTAVKGIKAARLKRIRVPLPPMAEQVRIIDTVDRLLLLCNQLESQLAATQDKSAGLLSAVLQEALTPIDYRSNSDIVPQPLEVDAL
jgi:type I restriction enzyme, S subunit